MSSLVLDIHAAKELYFNFENLYICPSDAKLSYKFKTDFLIFYLKLLILSWCFVCIYTYMYIQGRKVSIRVSQGLINIAREVSSYSANPNFVI